MAAPLANDDSFATNDQTPIAGNLITNDTPGDQPLLVTSVNGSAAAVGVQIILASGALLRVNADGTFTYDPNHAFDARPTASDTFTYTVSGGDGATVTVMVADGEIFGTDAGETINGTTGDDIINALGGNDTVNGLSGNDRINGGAGDDTLNGGPGNDTLDGGTGADTLTGGTGDDVYKIDNAGDVVNELAGEGYDIIDTAISYTLAPGAPIEELRTSTAGVVLTGNEADNVLRGVVLRGGGGNDSLYVTITSGSDLRGGTGNDTYYGGGFIYESPGEGYDTLVISTGSGTYFLAPGVEIEEIRTPGPQIQVHGNEFNQTFYGGDQNDYFRGNGGADVYYGGRGNDRYELDQFDTIVELPGEGTDDLVYVPFDYVLPTEIEHAVSRGSSISLTGNSSINSLLGDGGANLLFGLDGDDRLDGGGGNDSLYGGNGNDTLIGNAGNDLMVGGAGDDIYYLSGNDIIQEDDPNGGYDTIMGFSGTLAANQYIEALFGSGTMTGNQFAQTITGSNLSDVLDGGTGADILDGRSGSDTYYVDSDDKVIEAPNDSGTDTVYARSDHALLGGQGVEVLSAYSIANQGDLNLKGNERANTLVGTYGRNVLDGGGGVDVLNGFAGDDTYIVTAGDLVFEGANEGYDVVYATEDYVLNRGQYVEVLSAYSIAGQGALNLTGNTADNILVGTNGANVLDGGGGRDILNGYGGNDTFYVDNDDLVFEEVGGGSDTVYALTDYTLTAGQYIEVLSAFSIGWTNAQNLTGNSYENVIAGNNGANVIDGKEGNDYLVAFGGADTFSFTTALDPARNVDKIEGFVSGTDRIALDDAIFGGLAVGGLSANNFASGAAAADADDRIVYNPASGQLFYDADGNGAAAAVHFATLVGTPAVAASDFIVI